MAKTRTQFVCQQCGRKGAKALGRCPQCGSWNSMIEEVVSPRRMGRGGAGIRGTGAQPLLLADIKGEGHERLSLPIGEMARVLGGGVVPGSLVLVGGEPGIGKSTLLLQMAMSVAEKEEVLYVSAEESLPQVRARAMRLAHNGALPRNLLVLAETDIVAVVEHVRRLAPRMVVVDSIQSVHLPEIQSSIGSISQVREAASHLQALAKQSGVAIFLIGHVTKEGVIAGPKVLEHIVDTVLYLEGDRFHAYRLLRSVKNRYGATTEVGVFEMRASGMKEVLNPSEAFLAERALNVPGSAIAVTMEGTRPLLVEVQGLTSPTAFGHPRRTANGVDFNRLLLTVAVLSRRVGLNLAAQDVFVNVVGGMHVSEPAVDLAVATAIASCVKDFPLRADLVLIGEIGLTGELRAVAQLPARLREAAKLGFKKAVHPKGMLADEDLPAGIELLAARSLEEALGFALQTG